MKKFLWFFVGIAVAAVCAGIGFAGRYCVQIQERTAGGSAAAEDKPSEIIGYGYLRGRSQYALKNKYGSFVSKVHIYSYKPVKKGDCILEYDDYDVRVEITKMENNISELERELALKETQLALVRLDPLPSDYRNINWKTSRAKELLNRTENEWNVYRRLFKSKSVSDLDLRSKQQAYYDALASYRIVIADQEKVGRGLSSLYVQKAEQEVASVRARIASAKRELELLREKLKYYKIIAPYDGIIKTHSDTVGAWNAAATEAACLHRVEKGYKIYGYFEEKDIKYITDGMMAQFFSHDTGKWYDMQSVELTRTRTTVGDRIFHLVKFNVKSKVDSKVRLEGAVIIRIKL